MDFDIPEEAPPPQVGLGTVLCDKYGLEDGPIDLPMDEFLPARLALRTQLSTNFQAIAKFFPDITRIASTPPMSLQVMRTAESLRCDLESRGEFSAFLDESVVVQLQRIWPFDPRDRP
jgi:hypothetical protein